MSKPVLLDNTVLSNLALVGQMDVVFHLWPERVASTPAVLREYEVAARGGLLPPRAWADLPLLELTAQESAISARLCKRLGVPVAGTLGILALAVRRGLLALAEANALLADVVSAGYRSPVDDVDELI